MGLVEQLVNEIYPKRPSDQPNVAGDWNSPVRERMVKLINDVLELAAQEADKVYAEHLDSSANDIAARIRTLKGGS